MKVFREFRDRNIVLAKSPFVSGRTGSLLRTNSGKCCVFPVIISPKTRLQIKKDIFLVNTSLIA